MLKLAVRRTWPTDGLGPVASARSHGAAPLVFRTMFTDRIRKSNAKKQTNHIIYHWRPATNMTQGGMDRMEQGRCPCFTLRTSHVI